MRDALPGLSLREAKPLVHRNLPLATRRAAEELWDDMERAAAELARQSAGDNRRSTDEIRDHFKAWIMAAVLRPGMWGGEIALRLFLDDLAWIDGSETPRGPAQDALAAMGAFSPAGVTGVFTRMFGGIPADHLSAVGMVYANLAWAWGYLEPESTLTAGEYARLRRDARKWATTADRAPADAVAEFGEPSLGLPGYNPRFPGQLWLPPARPFPAPCRLRLLAGCRVGSKEPRITVRA